MRPVTATATAVTTILGVGATAVAAGRYASDVALKAAPGRPLPADRRLTVHATAAGQVTLTRSFSALRPGTYGLSGPGVHAVVGPVVEGASQAADTVVRRLESVGRGLLEPGAKVRLTPALYDGDPGGDLGLDHQEVEIPGELGTLPAWYVPGARDTWVITVHGLGTTRAHPMNLMGFLREQSFPVLDLAYRGDPGAPRPADGLGHFGASEWRDLDAALRWALRHGARDVIVHGWSTGATMALYAAVESPLRDRISGLVLDSPVLDWALTLRALAAARGVPAALLPLAVRAAQGRTGMNAAPLLETSAPASLRTPTLILHGPDDTIAPWDASRELAALRPDLVSLHAVPQAPHASMWNAGPARYEETLRRFLTPLM
ncbi:MULTISPECIES: alpha/beta fold hydrolase [unclassified Streptomyces]|uniref:alpha/beta hydrolase family protein n=1 Tax=unclassified Streptomyces TaxID=2593676 RepID=UPI001BE8C39A|nr:alpha/beta fold hydrolase [Streptomyces sp. McG3]MBT2896723.1 prolyl oligopeptidase family serine peptidase [Streptomyces sp. McG3]